MFRRPISLLVLALPVVGLGAACSFEEETAGDGVAQGPTDPGTLSVMAVRTRDEAIARARGHIRANPGRVSQDADHGFNVRDVILDADGTEHVRFDRTYKGLRVVGGDLVVHGTRAGAFRGVDLAFAGSVSVNPAATVSGAAAEAKARQTFGANGSVTSRDLIVFADEGAAKLAYEVVVAGSLGTGEPSELHVVVDARSGNILSQWEGIETVTGTGNGFFDGNVSLETTALATGFSLQDGTRGGQRTKDMNNGTSGTGTLMTDADNAWGNGLLTDRASVGVDAQFGASVTWDYYLSAYGRSGIKNNGIGAESRVHYGSKYNNAYWSDSCFCMTYGDGDGTTFYPFASLDVAGHEMTHGVTAATANLAYRGESGGLNEATSDIFGTMVEYFANSAKDTPDYLIGEKLYVSNPSGTKALRYMYKPSLDGRSPDCYSSTLKRLDVHYSSGVANHFFYLLAEGSAPASGPSSPTCNGAAVVGIGRDKAGRIWYRALTTYMTSSTTYSGARAATISAAKDLYGAASAEATTVAAAWTAVTVL